ncbi:MAG TPA: hypothetical protein VHL31_11315 [Geminicoccus sp.]|jgi:hypothetical protein|uniref:hypothetical protein n=1 Tax=Geminicoccus sp. TaxID=2024832 RepID=UPI002E364F1B|nr:hypothetical protein [Geminicoccus sp.]HEX2526869.1 hypothetical protein [Geminicoccus sp.]
MRRRIVGTGITQKQVTTLVEMTTRGVREDPGLAQRTSFGGFAQFADDVREWAVRTLEAEGLPSRESRYVQVKDGSFLDVSGHTFAEVFQMDLRCAPGQKRPIGTNIEGVVKEAGLGLDSPAGYAAAMLTYLDRAEKSREGGRVDSAMEWSLRLGEAAAEARMKFRWEEHALRGQNNKEVLARNQPKSNATRHNESKKEWAIWQKKADELILEFPTYKKTPIAGKTSKWLFEKREAEKDQEREALKLGLPYHNDAPTIVRSQDAIARRITTDRKA